MDENNDYLTHLTIVIRGTHTFTDVLGDLNCIAIRPKNFPYYISDLDLTDVQQKELSKLSTILLESKFSECLIHKQFLINSLRIYLIICSFISKRKKDIEIKDLSEYHTINICGHSMGGSVATILSLLMYTVLLKKKKTLQSFPQQNTHLSIKRKINKKKGRYQI